VRVWRCAGGLLAVTRTPGLLLIDVTDYSTAIQRPNTCNFSNGVHWASEMCECCMVGSSNSSFATKSCACASLAFLVGIIFWFVDSMWRGMIYFVIILTEWWKTTRISYVDIPDISRAKIVSIMKSIPLDNTVVQVRPKMCTLLPNKSYVLYCWTKTLGTLLKNLTIAKSFFLNYTYHLFERCPWAFHISASL
jgi:hypothetical protein